MSLWNINMQCEVTFGEDSRLKAGELLKNYGATAVLLLYDIAMEQLGFRRELESAIADAGIRVVSYQTEDGEPTTKKTDRAYDFARSNHIDGIVALGGGSTLDTGKMVGKLLANGGKTEDYLHGPTANEKVFRPLITLPSTSGTGAEVTGTLACANEAGCKVASGTGNVPPTHALVDPVLTYGLPPQITVNTGIDALCHASEILCNCNCMPNPFADLLCKEVIRLVFKWLPAVYRDGSNQEARYWMSYAAMVAGYIICLRKISFGHPIANQISDAFHAPHGVGCGIGMLAFVHYNVTQNPEWVRMNAECLDIPQVGVAYETVAHQVVEAYHNLYAVCDVKSLKDLGAEESWLDEMVENLKGDPSVAYHPCPPDFDLLKRVLHEICALG